MMRMFGIAAVLVSGLVGGCSTVAAGTAASRPTSQPAMHMVAMSDGVKLATDVYVPGDEGGRYPAILIRTPYGRSGGKGMTAMAAEAGKRGYAIVSQDLRGRGQSEGHHAIIFHNDGWAKHRDGVDTVNWIAQQPWSDGSIATWGGSALGITQNMLAPVAPENLKAQWVMVAFSDMYSQSAYQGGAWRKALLEGWLKATKMEEGNLETFLAHPNYDSFWAELNPEALAGKVNAPAIFWGGWYDIFLQGTINSFVTIQNSGGPRAKGHCRLILGPWAHGSFTELKYPANSKQPKAADAWRFYDYWLKGKANDVAEDKPVYYYVMGDPTDSKAPGNYWRTAENWPPAATDTAYYFGANGSLTREAPAGDERKTYRYDPANPVPTVGGQNLLLPKGPMDQRKIETRPDVLLFTGPVLTEPVEVTGRIAAMLFVSSDCPDTDFTVKLCDVYPDGRSMLVTDGILRAAHRESMERADLLELGKTYKVTVDLWSTSLVFNKGHRIRVAVSSSNAPRFQPNPNTGRYPRDSKPRVANNTVYLSKECPSQITLPMYAGPENRLDEK